MVSSPVTPAKVLKRTDLLSKMMKKKKKRASPNLRKACRLKKEALQTAKRTPTTTRINWGS